MDIQEPPHITFHKVIGKHTHKACQNDEIRQVPIDFRGQRRIESCAIRIRAVAYDSRRDAVCARSIEPRSVGHVADDADRRYGKSRPEQRFHVAAPPGDEDHDAFHRLTR